jgi:hypothetical protein
MFGKLPSMTDKNNKITVAVEDLEFREITADASEETLKILVDKEAVHPLQRVHGDPYDTQPKNPRAEVMRRLAPAGAAHWSHRCYGLFAPGHPTPEVVVYVALEQLPTQALNRIDSKDLPGNINRYLEENGTALPHPNCAVFYAITNAAIHADGTVDPDHPVIVKKQKHGMRAAERLIHEVATRVQQAYGVHTFTTLSPLRGGVGAGAKGFRDWLVEHPEAREYLVTDERELLERLAPPLGLEAAAPLSEVLERANLAVHTLEPDEQQGLRAILQRLALIYLQKGKDPVASFHLGNGAEIAQLHWSPKTGTPSEQQGALGVMVNYRYEPALLTERKTHYAVTKDAPVAPSLLERLGMAADTQEAHAAPQSVVALKGGAHTPSAHAAKVGEGHERF